VCVANADGADDHRFVGTQLARSDIRKGLSRRYRMLLANLVDGSEKKLTYNEASTLTT
jgi:hypothetical protein